jgi:hypothetical protein
MCGKLLDRSINVSKVISSGTRRKKKGMLGVDIRKQLAQLGAGSCEKEFSYTVRTAVYYFTGILFTTLFVEGTADRCSVQRPLYCTHPCILYMLFHVYTVLCTSLHATITV